MFILNKDLQYLKNPIKTSLIDINEINSKEIFSNDKYIIVNKNKNYQIYNRKCDHAGGKIINKNNKFICPIHGWEFNPVIGEYTNGAKKKSIPFKILNEKIVVEENQFIPNISKSEKNEETRIRFLNHAFLEIKGKDFAFCTDPWAIGSAFNNGWWLKHKTKNDWKDILDKSDFIYISHNHPDHLHKLTLKNVSREKLIIVPAFISDSAGIFIESLGFKNIQRLEINKEYFFKKTNLNLCILKSGDFREDSGIYFSNGKFSALIDVDSNNINFNNLPRVDFYASSFAGGASGYPLMFDNYNDFEKKKIIQKNINFKIFNKTEMIKKSETKYFMPYAGFFEERLARDKYIKENNKKIKIKDYEKICLDVNVEVLNVENNDYFKFYGNQLKEKQNLKIEYHNDRSDDFYLTNQKKEYHAIDKEFIKNYFKNSNFKDNLKLFISLVDENFEKIIYSFSVDFSNDNIEYNEFKNDFIFEKNYKDKSNNLYLKCRIESFLNTIYNYEPWEDLSIGFQCKIKRFPNEYNVNFWHYFTNKYITKKNVREIQSCQNCNFIEQKFDSNILR